MRDVYANESYRATGNLNERSMMVHLYLNGLYFGLLEAIERPDDSFNAENRGGEDADYDVIKGVTSADNKNGYLHSGSFANYQYLTSFFDTRSDGTNLSIERGLLKLRKKLGVTKSEIRICYACHPIFGAA